MRNRRLDFRASQIMSKNTPTLMVCKIFIGITPPLLTPGLACAKSCIVSLWAERINVMIEFVTSYWLAAVPTAVTGMLLLGMMKKMRDERAKKEKALVAIAARRKHQG